MATTTGVMDREAEAGSRGKPETGPARSHVPALDAVRGLSMLMVAVYHMTFIKPSGPFELAYDFAAQSLWAQHSFSQHCAITVSSCNSSSSSATSSDAALL